MSKFTVDNSELMLELEKYVDSCEFKWAQTKKGKWRKKIKKRGKINERLGSMIKAIVNGLAASGNWSGYTWKDDFISQGILTVLLYVHNFDINNEKGNAHGYVTMIAKSAFMQYVKKEKTYSSTKQILYDFKDHFNTDMYGRNNIDYQDVKTK